jgi:calcineurin-like phosphoesterase family protein
MSDLYKVYLERMNNNPIEEFDGDDLKHLWFTSDTHFTHEKTRIKAARPFDNIGEMDREIIKQWNKIVKPNDIVYHLGDFGNLKMLKKLNGKIRLIMGNHERKEGLTVEELLEAGFDQVFEENVVIKVDGLIMNLIHEPSKNNPKLFNLFGHLHNLCIVKEFGINVGQDCNYFRPIDFEKISLYKRLKENAYKGELFL